MHQIEELCDTIVPVRSSRGLRKDKDDRDARDMKNQNISTTPLVLLNDFFPPQIRPPLAFHISKFFLFLS